MTGMAKASEKLRNFCDERKVRIDTLMELTRQSRTTVSAHVNGYREPDYATRRLYERVLKLPEMSFEPDGVDLIRQRTFDALAAEGVAPPQEFVAFLSAGNTQQIADAILRMPDSRREYLKELLGDWSIADDAPAQTGKIEPAPERKLEGRTAFSSPSLTQSAKIHTPPATQTGKIHVPPAVQLLKELQELKEPDFKEMEKNVAVLHEAVIAERSRRLAAMKKRA